MATYGGVEHIMPLRHDPRFHEFIRSCIDSMKEADGDDHHKSFTEIFSQLGLSENSNINNNILDQDNPESSSAASPLFTLSPSSSLSSELSHDVVPPPEKKHRRSDSASSINSELSSVCNELFESSDDADDPIMIKIEKCSDDCDARKRWRRNYGGFPPPICCMGRAGFQTMRHNGRFILTEMKISNQEFLHGCRENGRLMVHHVVHSDEKKM